MNALRSSPLSALAPASALHDFILSCCVAGAAAADERAVRDDHRMRDAFLGRVHRDCCVAVRAARRART